ncbi:unnamed protein product [Malus baccata var. baccata]
MNFLSQKLLPSSKSSLKFLSVVIVLFCYCHAAAVKLPNNEKIPALIVFGDSIVDPGNNNNIGTIVKCNFPPYGRDFIGKWPTGRFSNGRVPSDLIAESVGVKNILPAYLDPNLKIEDLLTGVSFASGGSGYDPLTPQIVITAAAGEERAATIVSKSIYIVCIGSDDIANTYLSTPVRRPYYDIPAYTDLMINSASSFLQELYGLGARRIGVINLPAIGCVPSQRTVGGGINRDCSETANQAARLFNSKLSANIDAFNKRLPEARVVYLDIYYTLLSLIQNPTQYGTYTWIQDLKWQIRAVVEQETSRLASCVLVTLREPAMIHRNTYSGTAIIPRRRHMRPLSLWFSIRKFVNSSDHQLLSLSSLNNQ